MFNLKVGQSIIFANLMYQLDELWDSTELYLYDAEHLHRQYAEWTSENKAKQLDKLCIALLDNEDYQEALHSNLKRLGVSTVTLYHGHTMKYKRKSKFQNGTLNKRYAENFYKSFNKKVDNWVVDEYRVSAKDIIGIGVASEYELLFIPGAKKMEIIF